MEFLNLVYFSLYEIEICVARYSLFCTCINWISKNISPGYTIILASICGPGMILEDKLRLQIVSLYLHLYNWVLFCELLVWKAHSFDMSNSYVIFQSHAPMSIHYFEYLQIPSPSQNEILQGYTQYKCELVYLTFFKAFNFLADILLICFLNRAIIIIYEKVLKCHKEDIYKILDFRILRF